MSAPGCTPTDLGPSRCSTPRPWRWRGDEFRASTVAGTRQGARRRLPTDSRPKRGQMHPRCIEPVFQRLPTEC